MINGKLVALSKARNMVLKHSLQNSCDVPKPVAGLRDPTLFSSETCSPSRLRKTTVSRLTAYSDSVKALKVLKRRQRRQRGSDESQDQSKPVHVLLETFHPYLNPKAALKQCLTGLVTKTIGNILLCFFPTDNGVLDTHTHTWRFNWLLFIAIRFFCQWDFPLKLSQSFLKNVPRTQNTN